MDPETVKRTDFNNFLVSFGDMAGNPPSLVGRSSRKLNEFNSDNDYVVLIYKEDNIDNDLRKEGYEIVKNAGRREGVWPSRKNTHGEEYFLVAVNGRSVTVKTDPPKMSGGKRRRTKKRRTKRRRTKRRKSNKNSKRKSRKTRR